MALCHYVYTTGCFFGAFQIGVSYEKCIIFVVLYIKISRIQSFFFSNSRIQFKEYYIVHLTKKQICCQILNTDLQPYIILCKDKLCASGPKKKNSLRYYLNVLKKERKMCIYDTNRCYHK